MKCNLIFIAILFSILFASCEEQMIMIPDPPTPPEGRVMLLEDYTGVNCVPCFGANAFVESVLAANPGSIVTYGVHGDLQSEPITGSKYDFRYEDAFDFEKSADIIGKPSASFNRTTLPNGRKVQLNVSSWQGFIDTELAKEQVVEIRMLSNYDSATRRADIDITVVPKEDISGEVSIHVVMTESHLMDPQNSPDGIVEFEHNHVMKASLTGLTGASLATDLVAGSDYRYSISYTLPEEVNEEWIPENMEVVAFITASDRDDEVLQAFQIHMTE